MVMNSIIMVKTFLEVASMHVQCLTKDVLNVGMVIQEYCRLCREGNTFPLSAFQIYLRALAKQK